MNGDALRRQLTYVLIDTDSYALGLQALDHSVRIFPVGEVLIYSDDPKRWKGFEGCVRPIPKIRSLDDYQDISIRRLVEDVRTDYCIVLQWDGFVLNPDEFSGLFRHYDYIGAAWPHFSHFNVGNSGFNWRSRGFLEASARLADLREPDEADDLFLCRRMRVTLEERHRIRFAPEAIAAHFSVEGRRMPWKTFGFHGVHLLPEVYRQSLPFLVENLSERIVARYGRGLEQLLGGADDRVRKLLRRRIDALAGTAEPDPVSMRPAASFRAPPGPGCAQPAPRGGEGSLGRPGAPFRGPAPSSESEDPP